MSLREDVSCDRDYILVNTSSWLKLISSFGGAPEIPIYQYFAESVRTLEDGSLVSEKTSQHEFKPIKVNLTAIETKTQEIKYRQTVLVSPFLTKNYFISQVVLPINEMSQVRAMFVVRPYRQEGDDLPVIYRVPDSQIKLFECGIQENAQVVVITDLQTNPINTKNCVHIIAKLFNIPREELSSMIFESEIEIKQDQQKPSQPKLTSNNLSKFDEKNKDKFFDDLEFEPPGIQVGRSAVPDEYANDPDLWYAIQASMNEASSQREIQQDDFNFEAKRNQLDLPEQEKVQTESTGENIASLNDAFETPKEKADQVIKTFGFLGQLSSTKNQQGPAINKQDYMRLIREKRKNQFEEKLMLAQKIVQNRESAALMMFGQSDCEKSMRGQIGQPFRLYGELSTSLQKLEAVTEMIANREEVKEAMRYQKRGSMTGFGEDADME